MHNNMEYNKYIPEVTELIKVIEEGVSKPIKGKLEDERYVVLKHPDSIFGIQSLVNELVAALIAEKLELNIPPFGICKITKDLISNSSADILMEFEDLEAGYYYYSEELKNVVPISKGQLMVQKIKTFPLERLILFDLLMYNKERHEGNILIKLDKSESIIYAIDHGTIFTDSTRYDKKSLRQMLKSDSLNICSILDNNKNIYQDLEFKYPLNIDSIKKEAAFIKETITVEYLDLIASIIPNEWKLPLNDEFELLFLNIKKRLMSLDSICDELVEIVRRRS